MKTRRKGKAVNPDSKFEEAKHKRGSGGKFTNKPGAGDDAPVKVKGASTAESPTKLVHSIADKMKGASKKDVIAASVAAGVHPSTAGKQYWMWQKKNANAKLTEVLGNKPIEAIKAAPDGRKALQALAARAVSPKAPEPEWKKISGKLGSNEGGIFENAAGDRIYAKLAKTDDHLRHELLANDIYEKLGVNTLKPRKVMIDGKAHIASDWKEVKKFEPNNPNHVALAQSQFGSHALVANRDAVGLSYDNLGFVDGKVTMLDAGGSLKYRAQGGLKEFGNKAGEWDSLRNANINQQSAKIFGDMTESKLQYAGNRLLYLQDKDIDALVLKHGLPDSVAQTLKSRKEDILDRAAKLNKPLVVPAPPPPVVAKAAAVVAAPAATAALAPVVAKAELPDLAKVGAVKYSHALFDSMKDASKKDIMAAAVKAGVNESTASTQFYKWKKAQGTLSVKGESAKLAAKDPSDMSEKELLDALEQHIAKPPVDVKDWDKLNGWHDVMTTKASYYGSYITPAPFESLKAIRDKAGVEYEYKNIAVQWYTGSGSSSINNTLRKAKDKFDISMDTKTTKAVRSLDKVISKGSFKEDTIMWRGIGPGEVVFNKSPPPATLRDHAFTSSSFNPKVAYGFSDKKTIFRIKVPKGFPALNVAIGSSANPDNGLTGEAEVLLPRGTGYRVLGRRVGAASDGKMDVVDLEPILPADYLKMIKAGTITE